MAESAPDEPMLLEVGLQVGQTINAIGNFPDEDLHEVDTPSRRFYGPDLVAATHGVELGTVCAVTADHDNHSKTISYGFPTVDSFRRVFQQTGERIMQPDGSLDREYSGEYKWCKKHMGDGVTPSKQFVPTRIQSKHRVGEMEDPRETYEIENTYDDWGRMRSQTVNVRGKKWRTLDVNYETGADGYSIEGMIIVTEVEYNHDGFVKYTTVKKRNANSNEVSAQTTYPDGRTEDPYAGASSSPQALLYYVYGPYGKSEMINW
jgi:hypothetical protein